MAEVQQGSHAVIFGLPSMDSNSVKTGTTGTPAAIAFKVLSISLNKTASEETTENTDGETVHVSTFNPKDEVTITGYYHGANRAAAVTASDLPEVAAVLVLTGASGGAKNDPDMMPTGGRSFRITGMRKNATTSAKQTVEFTAVYEPGMTYTHLS